MALAAMLVAPAAQAKIAGDIPPFKACATDLLKDNEGNLMAPLMAPVICGERHVPMRQSYDWPERLDAAEGVPSYVLAGMDQQPDHGLTWVAESCPDADVGIDALEACIFAVANDASRWVDSHQWLNGRDPRQRARTD
ncbi:hypothetical protein [Marimonas lutisalis]|uniref:hypothetical protein n=1 Tax=Marimonas lutisalis TaxID=2545756 RepID=UPI0013763E35|nr:hypothetical protein [Marimonas lutisalis]